MAQYSFRWNATRQSFLFFVTFIKIRKFIEEIPSTKIRMAKA